MLASITLLNISNGMVSSPRPWPSPPPVFMQYAASDQKLEAEKEWYSGLCKASSLGGKRLIQFVGNLHDSINSINSTMASQWQ